MGQKVIEQYDYLHRLDVATDLILLGCTKLNAYTLEELMPIAMPLLESAPQYVRDQVNNIQMPAVAAAIKPKNRKAVGTHFVAFKQYMADLTDAIEAGKPLIHHFPSMTPEPFIAMDVAPISVEALALYIAACFNDGVEVEADEFEAEGFASHTCAYQKAPFRAIEKGFLPMPDVFVTTTAPCNSSNMLYQYMIEKHQKPIFCVDSPYYWNKRSFEYFLNEYKNTIEGVQKVTGHKIDVDVLRKHVKMSNEQLSYQYKLQQLRRIKPNPDPGMHRALDTGAWLVAGSNELWIDYMKVLYEEAKLRADNGVGVVPEGMEEIRTLHTYGYLAHTIYMPDWLEENCGSSLAECGLSVYPGELVGLVDTTSLDSMLEGLAWRSFNAVMHRTVMTFVDLHINDMVKIAKEYQVDAAVFAGNHSCKYVWTLPKMLSEALQDNLGIPCLTFEFDLVDKRFTQREVVFGLLSEFFNNIRAGRKER